MNLLHGQLQVRNGALCIDLNTDGRVEPDLIAPVGSASRVGREHLDKKVVVGVRPEDLAIAETSNGSGSQLVFRRKVEVLEPTGPDTIAIFDLQGGEVLARLRAKDIAHAGPTVAFATPVSAIHLFDPDSGRRIDLNCERSAVCPPGLPRGLLERALQDTKDASTDARRRLKTRSP
jgi:multiple sugar transport system ATP-binding protein